MGSLGRHHRRWKRRSISPPMAVSGMQFWGLDGLKRLVGGMSDLFEACMRPTKVQKPPLKGILKRPSRGSSTESASSSDNEKIIDGNKTGKSRHVTFNQAVEVEFTPKREQLFCKEPSWFSRRVVKTTCFYSESEIDLLELREKIRRLREGESEERERIKMGREDTPTQEEHRRYWENFNAGIID